MKTYSMTVMTQVEVQAYSLGDAKEVVDEVFGDALFGALEIISHEICDEEELA